MKLVASAIIGNEVDRYLKPWLDHLLEFVDEVMLVVDDQAAATLELLDTYDPHRVVFWVNETPEFDAHEGRARQRLLEVTLARQPTHVLSIDADEFVTDGPALRRTLAKTSRLVAWSLEMSEVWELDGDCLCIRHDGHWRPYRATIAYAAGRDLGRIPDKQLACGRTPSEVRNAHAAGYSGVGILHFGWTNPTERRRRFDRYMRIDGGRFHNIRHLQSASPDYPEQLVDLEGRPWPDGLLPYRDEITYAALRPHLDVVRPPA